MPTKYLAIRLLLNPNFVQAIRFGSASVLGMRKSEQIFIRTMPYIIYIGSNLNFNKYFLRGKI